MKIREIPVEIFPDRLVADNVPVAYASCNYRVNIKAPPDIVEISPLGCDHPFFHIISSEFSVYARMRSRVLRPKRPLIKESRLPFRHCHIILAVPGKAAAL